MVVIFSPCDNDNPYLAGVQAVFGEGGTSLWQILAMSASLTGDWGFSKGWG